MARAFGCILSCKVCSYALFVNTMSKNTSKKFIFHIMCFKFGVHHLLNNITSITNAFYSLRIKNFEVLLHECHVEFKVNKYNNGRVLENMLILLICFLSTYLYGAFDCMFLSCHVAFQCESTLYSYLNIKELLARSRREI